MVPFIYRDLRYFMCMRLKIFYVHQCCCVYIYVIHADLGQKRVLDPLKLY